MAEPTKHEISQVFKRLRSTGANKVQYSRGKERGCGGKVTVQMFEEVTRKFMLEVVHLRSPFHFQGLFRLSSEKPYMGLSDVRRLLVYRL